MAVFLTRNSRLKYATLVVESNGTEDIEWFDLPRLPRAVPAASDTIYTVTASDSIDGLASDVYGDSILWDLIADINMMWELPQELVPNTIIRIPSKNRALGNLRG
jgi:nucleoid-associated protein YgaU